MAKGGKREGAGRPPGAINRRSKAVVDRIEERYPGFNPVEAMIALAHEELALLADGPVTPDEFALVLAEQDPKARDIGFKRMFARWVASKDFALTALKEAAQYIEPKRKAVELSGEIKTGKERPDDLRDLARALRASTSISGPTTAHD